MKAMKKTNSGRDPRPERALDREVLHQRIAETAYGLFLKRGAVHGSDVEDWLEAQRVVSAESRSHARSEPALPRNRALRSASGRQRVVED